MAGAVAAPLQLHEGALLVLGVYVLVAALHVALPARETVGYACDYETGKPLRYRLNGLGVLGAVVLVWAALAWLGVAPASLVAQLYWPALCAACALGMALSSAFLARGLLVLRPAGLEQKCVRGPTADRAGRPRPSVQDLQAYDARSLAAHFYLGMEFNPRWAMFDVKMFLYLVGAVMLSLNVLSAAALQAEQDGTLSRAMQTYVACFAWFCCEYLFFEARGSCNALAWAPAARSASPVQRWWAMGTAHHRLIWNRLSCLVVKSPRDGTSRASARG
jgi:delta14-sterol reductase